MDSEGEYTFRNTSLPQHSFNFFTVLRNQKKFCDVEFNVGNQRISAHRVILTATMPLFRETLFEEEIPVPDLDPSVLECLIDYSYSCELKITMVNVKGLLAGACALHMKDVQDACCDFLFQRLNPENVLNFRDLAVELNISHLRENADFYIKEHFEEVSNTEGLLHTPLTYVKELIGKDDLNVVSEEKVLEFVLRWVKVSLNERKGNLTELLREVRMVLLKPLYLRDVVEREELIRTSLSARDLIDEARDYNLFPERRKAVCSFSTETRQFMKICRGTEETGYTIHSLDVIFKCKLSQLDLVKGTWSTKFSQEYNLNDGCVATLNEKMYFFQRGYTIEYNPAEDKYRFFQSVATPKKYAAAAAASLRGKIFVCGGYVGKCVASNIVECLASNIVECFDPDQNKWTQIKPLPTARGFLNAVSLGDYIYALGGRENQKVYGTVERYSFNTNKWQYVSSLLNRRYRSASAALNGRIYVCGGNTAEISGYPLTATAEVYDPVVNRWNMISPMNTAWSKIRLVTFRGKLYGMSDADSHCKIVNSHEIYDPETGEWTYGPSIPQLLVYRETLKRLAPTSIPPVSSNKILKSSER